ncbi:MAG TPA: hypothetical protein VK536_01590, partial [Candidatus Limnocylindrales bacterium]|nr:hypothetical protein [Candidatus Limnocylindrales bacterium]
MTITRVQGNARGTSGTTSCSVTLGQTPTQGNILIACITCEAWKSGGGQTGSVGSITQTGVTWGSSPVVKSGSYCGSSTYYDAEIWIGIVGSGASTSISITESGGGTAPGIVADVCEYSGVATSSYLDQTQTAASSGSSSTPTTGTTSTTTQAIELWIGCIITSGQAETSATNSFTLLDGAEYSGTL